jgi:uncharacterized protein YndB with AHSA1/START domain
MVATNSFDYTIFIRTSPETLWLALTEPVMTQQWWGVSLYSDWNEGSLVDFEMRDVLIHDDEQVVRTSIPFQRLSFTWHTFTPEWASAHDFAESMRDSFAREPRSTVHFDLEQIGENTRLMVSHDGFGPHSTVLAAVRQGWPSLLSSLKSFLETGTALSL